MVSNNFRLEEIPWLFWVFIQFEVGCFLIWVEHFFLCLGLFFSFCESWSCFDFVFVFPVRFSPSLFIWLFNIFWSLWYISSIQIYLWVFDNSLNAFFLCLDKWVAHHLWVDLDKPLELTWAEAALATDTSEVFVRVNELLFIWAESHDAVLGILRNIIDIKPNFTRTQRLTVFDALRKLVNAGEKILCFGKS